MPTSKHVATRGRRTHGRTSPPRRHDGNWENSNFKWIARGMLTVRHTDGGSWQRENGTPNTKTRSLRAQGTAEKRNGITRRREDHVGRRSETGARNGRRGATDGPSIEEGNFEAQNGKTHQKFVEEAPRGKSTILSARGQKESHEASTETGRPCGKRVTRRASPEEEGCRSRGAARRSRATISSDGDTGCTCLRIARAESRRSDEETRWATRRLNGSVPAVQSWRSSRETLGKSFGDFAPPTSVCIEDHR